MNKAETMKHHIHILYLSSKFMVRNLTNISILKNEKNELFLLSFLWTETKSRSIKTQKKNEADIQLS